MEAFKGAATSAQRYVEENKKTVLIAAGATTVALGAAYAWRRAVNNYVPKSGPYPVSTLPSGNQPWTTAADHALAARIALGRAPAALFPKLHTVVVQCAAVCSFCAARSP